MSQTSGYGFSQTPASAGDQASLMTSVVDSYAADAAIGFGLGVIQGAADDTCKVCDSASGAFLGVALRTQTIESNGVSEGYAAEDSVSVLGFGRVWMETASAAAKNADAYIVVASGADRGKVTDVSTDNLGPIGKYISAGADGDLCVIEITRALRGATGPQGPAGT